jgi:hypothetical protein
MYEDAQITFLDIFLSKSFVSGYSPFASSYNLVEVMRDWEGYYKEAWQPL